MKLRDQLGAVRRVHDLRVELHAVILALLVGDEGIGSVGGGRDDLETLGQRRDAVAVAHPDLMARAGGPEALEQLAILVDVEEGAAEFAVMAALDLAAELHAHRLLAVADAEHRQAAVEDDLRRARRAFVDRRSRAAGQDHGFRLKALEALFGGLEGNDLAIDARFAHAACDQLGYLAAEIDDENTVGMCCLGHGEPLMKSTRSCNAGNRLQPGFYCPDCPSFEGISEPEDTVLQRREQAVDGIGELAVDDMQIFRPAGNMLQFLDAVGNSAKPDQRQLVALAGAQNREGLHVHHVGGDTRCRRPPR